MYTGFAKLDTGKEKAESWNGPTWEIMIMMAGVTMMIMISMIMIYEVGDDDCQVKQLNKFSVIESGESHLVMMIEMLMTL